MGKIERMVFMEVKALFPALTLCVRVYDYLSTKCKAFQSKKIKFFIFLLSTTVFATGIYTGGFPLYEFSKHLTIILVEPLLSVEPLPTVIAVGLVFFVKIYKQTSALIAAIISDISYWVLWQLNN